MPLDNCDCEYVVFSLSSDTDCTGAGVVIVHAEVVVKSGFINYVVYVFQSILSISCDLTSSSSFTRLFTLFAETTKTSLSWVMQAEVGRGQEACPLQLHKSRLDIIFLVKLWALELLGRSKLVSTS